MTTAFAVQYRNASVQADLFVQPKHGKPSQTQRVFYHLQRFGSISDLEAYRDLRIRRLAARIFELRLPPYGLNITTLTEKHEGGTHARYLLVR